MLSLEIRTIGYKNTTSHKIKNSSWNKMLEMF